MQFSLSLTFTEYNSYRIKMRYSIEPRERRHVKGYGFYLLLEILVNMQLKLLKT